MLKNYLKIAWRNLVKEKLYSAINIIGLAVGIACCLFILLYIRKELSYDTFHSKADRIYRISSSYKNSDGWLTTAWASGPVGPILKKAIPEVEAMAQLSGGWSATIVERSDLKFYERGFTFATAAFFEIFDFPVLSGDPSQSLQEPYTVFLSESMAEKYFPGEDPLGKTLEINNEHIYTVTGIFKDIPDNSHIRFNFVASRESQYASGLARNDWMRGLVYTYVLLNERADQDIFKSKLGSFRDNYLTEPFNSEKGENASVALVATPLTDIHLFTNFSSEMIPQGDITYVYIFSAIALLILIIACINYMNLATARASKRAREVGIRKATGAQRGQLVRQYLSEAYIFALIAIVLSVLLAELFLPAVNDLMHRSMKISWMDLNLLGILAGLWLVVGLGAGGYPALYLSGFQPMSVLKGIRQLRSKAWLRKSLIIFQLAISITLIICTIVIQRQMQLVRASQPGYDREQVVIIPTQREVGEDFAALKSRLQPYNGIQTVTTCSFEPGRPGFISFFEAKDIEGVDTSDPIVMDGISAGFDFTETFGLTIVQGRSFSENYETDLEQAVIVNETAVKEFGWNDPIGKTINHWGGKKRVVGIVEDFHYRSLKEEIVPLIITPVNSASRFIAIKLKGNNISAAMSQIQSVWKEVVPQLPFTYSFLDDAFDALYRTELRLNILITIFSILAILIACLGLVGLSAYMAEQRTREIGIRKVLGASVQQIVSLLTKDFMKWMVIGLAIAIPLAQYVMAEWLKIFEYKVEIGIEIYLIAGCMVCILVLFALSWQSIRAALANPVESLRSE